MIPGGALEEREAVDEVLGLRARVIRGYLSHLLSFPQRACTFTTRRITKYASSIQPGVKVPLIATRCLFQVGLIGNFHTFLPHGMKAVLGTIGSHATPLARHLKMGSWHVGRDLLVVWSQAMFAPPLSFVRLSSLKSLVQEHVQRQSRSPALLPLRSHLGLPPCLLAVWSLLPEESLALHLLHFAKSHQLQLVCFGHEVPPNVLQVCVQR
jgi:hypothetical protein